MTQHDQTDTTNEATKEDPLGAFGEFLAGMVEGILSALDDEGIDLGPLGGPEHELTEDCWCGPEVEHVEPRPFFDDDEVIIDKRTPAVVVAADPDINGCVCVRVLDGTKFWGWRTDQLVVLHPRRLSRPVEEVSPPPTYEVHLGETVLLVDDGEVRFDEATMVLTLDEAEALSRQLDAHLCPF